MIVNTDTYLFICNDLHAIMNSYDTAIMMIVTGPLD